MRTGRVLLMAAALLVGACSGESTTSPSAMTRLPGELLAIGTDTATGATLETDKDDYAPGEVVHLRGSGWAPNETVHLHMTEEPDTHGDVDQDVQADGTGAFSLHFYDVQQHDLGVTFTLTGAGATSGSRVTVTFTDGNLRLQPNPTPNPFSPNGDGQRDLVTIAVANAGTGTETGITVSVRLQGSGTAGSALRTFAVGTLAGNGSTSFTWDGKDASAALLADGTYTLRVYNATQTEATASPQRDEDVVLDNTPPVVSAVLALPANATIGTPVPVTVTATATDALSRITAGALRIDGGSPIAMSAADGTFNALIEGLTATIPGATIAALTLGTHQLCVTATDLAANTTLVPVCTTFTVNALPNSPPVANAGPDYTGAEGSDVSLAGTATDPDGAGDIASTKWTVSGTNASYCSFDDDTKLDARVTCVDNGAWTLTLTVTDQAGATHSDDASLVISNVAPTATYGNTGPVNEGSSFTLSLTSPQDPSTVDVAAGLQYAFDCGSGYSAYGASSSANCTTNDNGTRSTRGKIRDKDGGETEYSASVTVTNVAPTVSGVTAPSSIDEGQSILFSASGVTDPSSADVAAGFTYAFSCDNGATFTAYSATNSGSCPANDGPATITVAVKAKDKDGGESAAATSAVTVNNVAPTLTLLAGSSAPVPVGSTVNVTPTFSDPAGTYDTYTGEVNWDDGNGFVSAGGVASGSPISHTFNAAGVYTVCARIFDGDDTSNTVCFEYIVVYDPSAGFVTGGGWINSPAGAYKDDVTLTGKATFGFVSKYQKGANTPTGNTEFQFHAAGLNFRSTSYEWLVVAGPQGQYKGVGTINGVSGYGFILTAWDGQAPGGGGTDKFRMKIWRISDDSIVYDNQGGTDDQAPNTALAGGSIVVHTK